MREVKIFRTPAGRRLAFRSTEIAGITADHGNIEVETLYGSSYLVIASKPEVTVPDENPNEDREHHYFHWTPTPAAN